VNRKIKNLEVPTSIKILTIITLILVCITILGTIAFWFEVLLRFPSDEIDVESLLTGLWVMGFIFGSSGIITVLFAVKPIIKFLDSDITDPKPLQGKFLHKSIKRTFVTTLFISVAWVLYTTYFSVSNFSFISLWTSFVPLCLILLWILLRIIGVKRAKLLNICYEEFEEIGKQEHKREKEEKRKQREQIRSEIQRIEQKQKDRFKPGTTSVNFSNTQTLSNKERLDKLGQIISRTKEMRLTDLKSVLEFNNKPSLMKWLYSLEEGWKFTIKGDFIIFEEETEKKKIIEKTTAEKTRAFCLFCEAELPEVQDEGPLVCLNCGKKALYCEICKNILLAGQKAVQISTCKHVFHKNHIVEWIKAKGTCPICKAKTNEEYLRPFVPD